MPHTRASFVLGHHQEQASVICCQSGDTSLLVTDLTPFHPQSHLWPDQPGDVGTVHWEGGDATVGPCRMGAISPDGELFVDQAIPVKRGAEGWRFVVVHPLAGHFALPVGRQVTLRVDAEARHALSLGHSGCHLAALALNRALMPYWRKEVSERDALDQPDFDRLAIQTSRVEPMGSREQYRIGKSLRKKGVNSEALLADLPQIERGSTSSWQNGWRPVARSAAAGPARRSSTPVTGTARWKAGRSPSPVAAPTWVAWPNWGRSRYNWPPVRRGSPSRPGSLPDRPARMP